PLCNDRPESAEFQHALAQTLINMGLRLAAGGEHAEALTNFTRGREIQERLVAALPAHLGYREDLARVCLNRGGLQVQAGQARAAREDFTAALTQAQELEKRHGRSALTEQIQRLASYGRARALEQLRQYREALPDWDRALALAPAALRDVPLWGRAECLARAGEYRRAIDEARLLANNTRTAQQWYTLARIAGMACSSAAEDGGRPLAEREEFVVLAALQGVTWLESSERAGFFNASSARQQLQSDAALDGLRARTEFWEFVAHIRDKKE
ncbi:MAG TPA: hypothetical protein VEL76_01950, partial [Gemmataceae bacterium]|nr:hypothetical protein [Gemmataceae bacterium]